MRSPAPHASESAIQSSILAYLGALGLPAWRMNSRVLRVPGRDGRPRLLRFGGQRGMADIVAIGPGGRFVAIEVKSARGTVNPWQAALLLAVEKAGGVAIVARSAAEAARAMSAAFPRTIYHSDIASERLCPESARSSRKPSNIARSATFLTGPSGSG